MKHIIIVVIAFFLHGHLNAQITDKLSVELNIGRLATEAGILHHGYYPNSISYINGFSVGYNLSDKWQPYLGVRNANSSTISRGGFSGDYSHKTGVEFRLGTKLSPGGHKRVFLSYGLEVFGEFSEHQGTYWTDTEPFYMEINHKKTFIGVAPSLALNVKFTDKIMLFVDTRVRLGKTTSTQIGSTRPSLELYSNGESLNSIFEPVNALGLRFVL